ncbi:MAG TPA: hypothetical protein VMP00_11860 [Burkholderiales bacterium]|nr:hypothetical protein [Burkholderiales bacterium]
MQATATVTQDSPDGSGILKQAVDLAGARAHEAGDEAADAARPAVEQIAAGAHQAIDRIAGAATQAAETLGLSGEQMKNVQAQVEQCREYVRDHPLASLGMAVAAGYVLSRLLSSR